MIVYDAPDEKTPASFTAVVIDLALIAGSGNVGFIYRFLLHRKDKLSLCLQPCNKFTHLTEIILIGFIGGGVKML